ncbi:MULTISPECIES: enoyl-CoA hydratase/isomerase family protein [unclassified Marinobacterium]|jgi:methylglutaconyl-CoA hydratase|uniref:enoyl-CoA hydratase/isomerase family protein n=1 Tax=unclassified Marinobacterium TaxID=2644139 RepID=UPI0015693339|nr:MULTISPECIES: enoyl-CoA hydratase/isomerase family protein [unclassified Marinobacterium]NRP10650.1 2,3-dehydroadipyl-CoA hydratase [Marinobacterium sp. xm-g-48]NRP46770.1 2,3-dehydroadipyl-CoA hydratase [Marinobacterium sp. xm-d-543]NRP83646.1 2,3-dehydroadipyl-CoA hydratase [Marinobacterium sp. xm-d-509]NRQ01984.1 2,3-dehydroadipyl-CoA hydratase [Marinobacterium sp. xm-d-530]NRQ23327.1 2,3-dehydroadipyl-CoA hydratase [Marinobacterium sp. xm-m-312]
MSESLVLLEKTKSGCANLVINRPEVHNAFDDTIIEQLITGLKEAENDPDVRVLALRSNGKNFSAGADLGWMKRIANNSYAENLVDAGRLAELMRCLYQFSKPTICLVQGAAYGGAVGLAACCDIVIAEEGSRFCLSEVKIGLIPAVISPYVVRAIGERQSRRFFLTAEPFNALEAYRFGLVHEVVSDSTQFDEALEKFTSILIGNSPQGMHAAKDLIFAVSNKEIDEPLINDTARRIAEIRVSPEGQEGLGAFLEKRKPNWIQE